MEASKAQRKRAEASPQKADFVKEFGAKSVKDEPDGSWTCTVREQADVKKAYQMQAGSRKIDVEQGAEAQAKMSRERVIRHDGRMVEFPEELIEQTKHRFRPAGRNGKAPAERFSLSEAFGGYEQGPDGLWFVWNDGWEPTSLWRGATILSPQRDPDGNSWIEMEGEWYLDSEVA